VIGDFFCEVGNSNILNSTMGVRVNTSIGILIVLFWSNLPRNLSNFQGHIPCTSKRSEIF